MKKLNLFIVMALFAFTVNAQEVKFPGLDTSPADIAYFPLNTTKVKKGQDSAPLIKVVYSRPSVKGREIFGKLEPFGQVWRVGANESTEIRFFKPVVIGGKTIPAGAYSLFAIPEQDKWVVIINKQTDRWGAYTYDETKDVARVTVPVKPLTTTVEALAITFTPNASGANLIIGWDKTSVEVPVTIK
ncbi:hypothetical protein HDF26_004149 [Pedobacter cryoconitis]|uniref:DUF2911 domain-containing protein n=1 Tax=Pedobacter cryoconitis TaxID=188932 RepID=UPI0016081DDA|nr:DUF2911 domain-containing protein [Pedobacter cryoconitis]MBB6273689.1 hypothetical protein [Pedobacter cryoconitis]